MITQYSKNISYFFCTILLTISLSAISTNILAQTDLSAKEVVKRVDDNQRRTTDSAFTRMKLTTCKFGIKNGKTKCVKKARIKLVESAQINTGIDNKDSKSIVILLEPASERGIGMLTYTYENNERDNETWLYLSALGKVKRISVANSDDEEAEPTSLFGTEITTEDQENGKLDDYTYELLEQGEYRGRPVAVIESTPKLHRVNKSSYGKTRSWIDTERFITLKVQMFDKRDNPIKRIEIGKVRKTNNIWMGRSLTFMNLISQRLTNMKLEAISFDMKIDESFLTQRALTDQAFREKFLNNLRQQAQ